MPVVVNGFICVEADAGSQEATALMTALDADLRERYPGAPIHGIDVEEFRRTGGVFLIGRLEGVAVACGALRPFGVDGVGEVKRMFVRRGYRGRGFSRVVLQAVEQVARRSGYRAVRLETGLGQPEAMALYESAGYHLIPCYGVHAGEPDSRCYEKSLITSVGTAT